jgi:hypothetical protein
MNVNKLTLKVQEALGEAQTMAIRFGHQQVDVEHLLTAGPVAPGTGEATEGGGPRGERVGSSLHNRSFEPHLYLGGG